jgi:putative membrane-bound dehydrogenase-like protein
MHRLCFLACLSLLLTTLITVGQAPSNNDEGVLPVGADGKPLNFDFETGDLRDWTAAGDAFKGQPIKGDTVFPRRNDMKSQHQGQYWIGTYEKFGDKPQGTLTSVPFKVTHEWASFLIAGGPWPETCVELVRKDTGAVFFRASGIEEENLRRVVVDLKPVMGKEIFIRVVDKHSGHWGHINFDDFRFHAAKPSFPPRPTPAQPDLYKYAGLPPQKAAAAMTVPDGFTVKLFAGEPDVKQPIAFCIDDRGRLWVVEAYSYPQRQPEGKGKDRILIFEDSKGTGSFDKRTVFMEGLNLVSGIEIGFGGVWIGAAPHLLFVPVKPGEDKPAGPPQILLDGWGYQDTHETLNTFTWGPDGWLYGCHGVFTHSKVGKPGTPDKDRIPINAGVWRYHPTRHVFEVFAHGTSNPWGLDYNEYGQFFVEACVIPHNFHIIQGARYQRQAGPHFNPYTYADIPTIAEHRHYVGANPHGGNGRSDSAGGGHAHSGTMIYLGGAWPKEYHGQMFMGNIHGHRLNIDKLTPKGSGYVASRAPDFLLSHDSWAMFVNMRYGPDGNAYVIDWYDKQSCHTGNPQVWDRSNGRIYKICHKDAKPVGRVDLSKCTDEELINYQLHPNDWYARHARRLLQERGPNVKGMSKLRATLKTDKHEKHRLRALWALYAIGNLGGLEPVNYVADDGMPTPNFTKLEVLEGGVLPNVWLEDSSEHVRAWTIRLAYEHFLFDLGRVPDHVTNQVLWLARQDKSAVVRLAIASTLQRLPLENRWAYAQALLSHGEDAADHNLPLMYWYAVEPLAEKEPAKALDLALGAKVPQVLQFMTRRIATAATPEALTLLVDRLAKITDDSKQLAMLHGLQDGLKGKRDLPMPVAWPQAVAVLAGSKNPEVRNGATALAVIFGDAKALEAMRKLLATPGADVAARQQALAVLLAARDKQLLPLLHQLVHEPALRGLALRALASYDDPKTPAVILAIYPSLTTDEKRDALNTLASRMSYGKALMDAVAAKNIAASEVSADVVRQLRNLNDKALDQRIADVWGLVRTTPAERLKQIADWRKFLVMSTKTPDLSLGRAIFAKTCQQCHTLFATGGKVGPDITGANRASLDYLLENIVDPSAVIPKEYTSTVLELKNGRVITGIVKGETPAALTVVTVNETLTVPRDDIDTMKPSNVSMMPDDLLNPLSKEEVQALIAYLQSPVQVPLLATPDNVKDFFNGKDLSGWDGDSKLWRVEKGEIVGKSAGLKEHAVLRSHITAGEFKLTFQVKLVPKSGKAGVHYHSSLTQDGDIKGPQASLGAGWWGKLYDVGGRKVIWDKAADALVKENDWNNVAIEVTGTSVKMWINGKLCADFDDTRMPSRGIFALEMQAGPAMEVRFRDLQLVVPAK